MYDFDDLMTEVLRSKPEISRDSLMEQVREKKRTVGSGYLTDQGALFLIAGELGVRLQDMVTADLTLKDLHIGANDITVVARVLAIYPVAEFQKKDGSGTGRYRRVNLFDRNGVGRLTIWEDNEEAMKLSGIVVDMPVRVVSAGLVMTCSSATRACKISSLERHACAGGERSRSRRDCVSKRT